MMNKLATGILLLVGLVTWLLGILFLGITTRLAVWGRAIEPEGKPYGNCWTYALPRWHSHGGYLLIRPAADVRLLRIFRIPHVAWVPELPPEGLQVEQFHPLNRSKAKWLPWKVIWYHGKVHRREMPKRPSWYDWHRHDERHHDDPA